MSYQASSGKTSSELKSNVKMLQYDKPRSVSITRLWLVNVMEPTDRRRVVNRTLVTTTQTTTILRALFWGHPGEPVPEENFSSGLYGAKED